MEIVVDVASGAVTLAEPADLRHFSVRAVGGPPDPEVLGRVLTASGVGRMGGGDHAFIDPGALRRLAGAHVGEGWGEEFEAMCAYAASKGWVDPTDGALRAHVTGEPAAG